MRTKYSFGLIAASLLLTGCQFISISNEVLPEGFGNGNQENEVRNIEYYDGDVFDSKDFVAHEVIFNASSDDSQKELSTENDIKNIIADNSNIINSIANIRNVAQFHGLKIGHLNNEIDGNISFFTTLEIKALTIIAKPRYNVVYSTFDATTVIDKNIAINVNDSKYIRVKSDFHDVEDIEESVLNYTINTEAKDYIANSVNINVYGERVEISKIIFYS